MGKGGGVQGRGGGTGGGVPTPWGEGGRYGVGYQLPGGVRGGGVQGGVPTSWGEGGGTGPHHGKVLQCIVG